MSEFEEFMILMNLAAVYLESVPYTGEVVLQANSGTGREWIVTRGERKHLLSMIRSTIEQVKAEQLLGHSN